MKFELNLKNISIIIAIVAILLGLIESTQALKLLTFVGDDLIGGALAIILSILGIGGIYLSIKDHLKLAALQYLICGICIFICIYLVGLYVAIIFVLAAAVCLIAAFKDKNSEVETDKKLWLIPAITVIIFILFLAFSVVASDMELQENSNSIHLNGLNSDIALEYGFYSGNIKGNIQLDKDFDYLCVKVNFYNANNVSITDSIAFINNNVKSGTYQLDAFYMEKDQPVRAEINVYAEAGDANPIYTQTLNL